MLLSYLRLKFMDFGGFSAGRLGGVAGSLVEYVNVLLLPKVHTLFLRLRASKWYEFYYIAIT